MVITEETPNIPTSIFLRPTCAQSFPPLSMVKSMSSRPKGYLILVLLKMSLEFVTSVIKLWNKHSHACFRQSFNVDFYRTCPPADWLL